MTILYITAVLLIGALAGYLVAQRATRREALQNAELRTQNAALETRLQAAEQQHEALRETHRQTLEEREAAYAQAIQRERESAQTLLQEAKASYHESLEAMKARFSQMAEEAMKARAQELKQANEEHIGHLVRPVREELHKMQQSVNEAREHASARHASMDKTIEGLLQHTLEVEKNAASLAQALQSNGKMQGDWGEQLLAGILEDSGLRPGIEFEAQGNLKDEEGNNLRPDIIVNCPGDRRIVIDSKVSLTAYLNYVSAQTREQVEQAQRENLRSVRAHIDELARKQYDKLVPGALSQVLMFIPNEGSYILALRTDPQLGQYAYKKGIILINPTNLMLALQMIFNLWQTERQNRNTEKVTRQAADLYDKFATFVEKFEKIRAGITSLQNNTEDAYKSLSSGTGNIVRRLEGLRQMGITPKKQLDRELTDTATEIPEEI